MGDMLYINELRTRINCAESELQEAFDSRKPFYEVKEIVQRLKLLLNELATAGELPIDTSAIYTGILNTSETEEPLPPPNNQPGSSDVRNS